MTEPSRTSSTSPLEAAIVAAIGLTLGVGLALVEPFILPFLP